MTSAVDRVKLEPKALEAAFAAYMSAPGVGNAHLTERPLDVQMRSAITAYLAAALAPVEAEPHAWMGYWPGAGSVNSETHTTHSRPRAEAWRRDGVEVTPLYTKRVERFDSQEVAWLIETNGPLWWRSSSRGRPPSIHVLNSTDRNEWTPDAHQAVRFSRKEDAEAVVAAMDGAPMIAEIRATEHVFLYTHPNPSREYRENWASFMEAFERVAGEGRDEMKHELRVARARVAELEATVANPSPSAAGDIPDLLDRYWDLAYAEGKEGRDHDTPNGDAQEVRTKLNLAFIAGMNPSPTSAENAPVGPSAAGEGWVLVPREVAERIARHADRYDTIPGVYVCHDNVELWQSPGVDVTITVGDCRAVRSALAASPTPPPTGEREAALEEAAKLADTFAAFDPPFGKDEFGIYEAGNQRAKRIAETIRALGATP